MFVLSNFIVSAARVIDLILIALYWLILLRALVSWVNPDPSNPIVQFLHRTTEPLLQPLRRFLPVAGIDLSPIIAFLIVIFLRSFVVRTLFDWGYRISNSL